MAERLAKPIREGLRWGAVAIAIGVIIVYLGAQTQTNDLSFGRSPSSANPVTEGSAGELAEVELPSVSAMTAMVAQDKVVRLPGAAAYWNEAAVAAAAGSTEVRILVAPAGLSKDQAKQVRDVENATITIVGTEVSGGMYTSSADVVDQWQAQFITGDVTDQLLGLLEAIIEPPPPEQETDRAALEWRPPTAAELDPVIAELGKNGLYVDSRATLTKAPGNLGEAFPEGGALIAAFPTQKFGAPVPHYGPALAARYPNRPILVMYGSLVEYSGPGVEAFGSVLTAGFYGQLGDRISRYAYPQDNILGAFLNQMIDIRYAGLFDLPLPYRPIDPVRVALPALPWIFGGCVVVFLVLSTRPVLSPGRKSLRGIGTRSGIGVAARLAGLSSLAVEMSGLTDSTTNAALTRGIKRLGAASDALTKNLPERQVRMLLTRAAVELDSVAVALGRPEYRPVEYLQGTAR